MINACCKNCEARRLGCHSTCEAYAAFKVQVTAENQAERQRRAACAYDEKMERARLRRLSYSQ